VPSHIISRRAALLACAGAAGCGRKKATGFPGFAFVANRAGRSVTAVDLTRFAVAGRIALDAAPSAVIAHPRFARVFVLAPENGTVYEIDARERAVKRRVRVGTAALGMQLAVEQDALWVASRDPAQLVEIPFETMTPRRRIALPQPPDDFDLSQQGGLAAVAFHGGSIALASLAKSAVERTIAAPSEPTLVRFQFDGRQLISGSAPDRSVTIHDVATGRTVVRLPLAVEPRQFCFTPNGGHLFVSGPGMDGVAIVYPYDTEVAETILAGRAPGAMTVTVTPYYLMVANPQTDSVTVLDIETRKLVAVVNVGQEPGQIVITPDRQYALVLNHRSGDLAVIRVASLAARRYKSAPLFTMIPVGEGPVSAAVARLG
jgi:YVTN family beta-propeller protein